MCVCSSVLAIFPPSWALACQPLWAVTLIQLSLLALGWVRDMKNRAWNLSEGTGLSLVWLFYFIFLRQDATLWPWLAHILVYFLLLWWHSLTERSLELKGFVSAQRSRGTESHGEEDMPPAGEMWRQECTDLAGHSSFALRKQTEKRTWEQAIHI